jgi:hypothetical protein
MMGHDSDRDEAGAVRALLVMAASDGPPETDLLDKGRFRARRPRRRVLVPSLATLAAASVLAVAALVASAVTGAGTPSAQARVAAAAGRTAAMSYRFRIVMTRSTGTKASQPTKRPAPQIYQGSFDPSRRTGRLLTPDGGLEIRLVGDTIYEEVPPADRSGGKRWLAKKREFGPGAIPLFVRLDKLAWQDPQQALASLRSAAAVHDRGRVSGTGWSGRRYAFALPDDPSQKPPGLGFRVTGSVDIDQAGRVRRLEVTDTQTVSTSGRQASATIHTVTEFSDFGVQVAVSAPPADEILAQASKPPANSAQKTPATQKASATPRS